MGDQVRPEFRYVGMVVFVVLVAASVLLWVLPGATAKATDELLEPARFAWPVRPEMTAMFMGRLPRHHEARAGASLARSAVGPGASGRGQVVVALPYTGRTLSTARADAVRERIVGDPAASSVAAPAVSPSGTATLVAFVPALDAEAPASKALVDRLRRALPAVAGEDASVEVGGVSAAQLDYEQQIRGSLWKVFVLVLAICSPSSSSC